MTYIMKISKAGYDVLTTGNANLIFSSSLATHSIHSITTVNKPANTQTVTLTHDFGYVPKVWIYKDYDPALGSIFSRIPIKYSVSTYGRVDFKITSTQVIISTNTSGNYYTNSYNYYVIIFTRSANP